MTLGIFNTFQEIKSYLWLVTTLLDMDALNQATGRVTGFTNSAVFSSSRSDFVTGTSQITILKNNGIILGLNLASIHY